MGAIRRGLLVGCRPERLVDVAKELVVHGAEILSCGRTAQVLASAGVPVTQLPSAFSSGDSGVALKLLHPRIQGGLLGDWDDPEQRLELERQGVRRIDLVLVDLPRPGAPQVESAAEDDALRVGGAAILRAAALHPRWVIALSEVEDFSSVIAALDGPQGRVAEELRDSLARKALLTVARQDAALAGQLLGDDDLPDSWSLQFQRSSQLALEVAEGERIGFYRLLQAGAPQLRLVGTGALTPDAVADADLAWTLVLGAGSRMAVAIAHHGALCGLAEGTADSEALVDVFRRARAADPRGAYGAVACCNRPLDESTAQAIAAAYLEAVVAPEFLAESRALLGRTRTKLLQAGDEALPVPRCRPTRWGFLLDWSDEVAGRRATPRVVSARHPDGAERQALDLGWRLVRPMTRLSLALTAPRNLLVAASGQTNWHDAVRVALARLPGGERPVAAACNSPVRFPEEIDMLFEAGVRAIAQPAGSPRQHELIARADERGLVLEVLEDSGALADGVPGSGRRRPG